MVNFTIKFSIGFCTLIVLGLGYQKAQGQCGAAAPFINITVNAAASNVTATTVDISGVTAVSTWQWMNRVGVVWSTITNPTLTTNTGIQSITVPAGTSLTGTFNASTITGLTPGTTYYLRSFGTYSYPTEGATCYGPQISFTTPALAPIGMTTAAPSAITTTTATSGGTVTILSGTPTIVERGVVYGTAIDPTTVSGTKVISGSGVGSYVSNLTGLTSSTAYYVRAYSIDNLGNIYYGSNQLFYTAFQVWEIVSPFSLSPSWYFGSGARYTFSSGSYPGVVPGPTIGSIGTNTSALVETSTSLSLRDGSVALYTNTMQAYNGSQTGSWSPNIRNFLTDVSCGGSSNGGGVAFPDPANNATNDAFYLIIGNDVTSGGCANAGVNRYRFTGTGTTVAYNAGKTLMAATDSSSEAITAGTDGSGGYWVVTHDKRANNNFYVWHFTESGISAPVRYTPATTASVSGTTSGGYLKFNPCMDKIAFAGFSGEITVYNFNRVTGAIGSEIARKDAVGKVGLEFSPDGTKIYYSGQGTIVSWFLISNPATGGDIAGSNSWSMQMGPDAQIYTSGVGGATVGVINDPNSASANHSAMTLAGSSTTYRGLTNISWLSPQLPQINNINSGCNTYDFSVLFRNYFNDNVTIKTNSYSWDFGDGSPLGTGAAPTHTYPSVVADYTVTLTFRDSCCNQLWTVTTIVNATCTTTPITLLSFKGQSLSTGNSLYWATANELNCQSFDIMKSEDGINFYSIGKTDCKNSNLAVNNYNFTDNNVSGTIHYYYLIQYDADGSSTNSKIIVITASGYEPKIYPNPSTNNFNISMLHEGAVEINVWDILGKSIEQKTIENGINTVTIGDNFSKGTYIVSITTIANTYYYKLVKE